MNSKFKKINMMKRLKKRTRILKKKFRN